MLCHSLVLGCHAHGFEWACLGTPRGSTCPPKAVGMAPNAVNDFHSGSHVFSQIPHLIKSRLHGGFWRTADKSRRENTENPTIPAFPDGTKIIHGIAPWGSKQRRIQVHHDGTTGTTKTNSKTFFCVVSVVPSWSHSYTTRGRTVVATRRTRFRKTSRRVYPCRRSAPMAERTLAH